MMKLAFFLVTFNFVLYFANESFASKPNFKFTEVTSNASEFNLITESIYDDESDLECALRKVVSPGMDGAGFKIN